MIYVKGGSYLINYKSKLDNELGENNLLYYRMLFLLAGLAYPGWYFVLFSFDNTIKDSFRDRVIIGFVIFLGYLYTFSPRVNLKVVLNLFSLYAGIITLHISFLVKNNGFSDLYQIVDIVTFACIAASMSTPKMLGSYIIMNIVTITAFASLYGSTKQSLLLIAIMVTMGLTFWPPLSMRIKLLNRLLATRRDLDLIVSNAAAGIITLDTNGLITSANSQAHLIFGYSDLKTHNISVFDLIHPQQKDAIQSLIKDFLAGREVPHEFIALNVRADKSPLWTRYRLNPILDRGISIGCVAVVIDVTMEQEANAIILAQKELLETLVTHSSSTDLAEKTCKILVNNLNLSYCFIWNQKQQGKIYEILGGFPKREDIPLTDSHLNSVVFQFQKFSGKNLEIYQETQPVSVDHSLPFSQNSNQPLGSMDLWHTIIKDRDQNIVGYLSLFRRNQDRPSKHEAKIIESCLSLFLLGIDKIKAGKTIIAQQTQITQSAKMASLGEMAGGIAHEINNPLAIIRGRFEQLRVTIKSPDFNKEMALKFCESGVQMIDRLKKIIQGLRQFSRDGARDPMIPVKIADIVSDTLVFCSEKYKIKGIQLDIPEIPPDIVIEGRHTQVSQVILNLLNNSFDAVANLPEKWVRLDVIRSESHPNICRLMITDSGQGITLETADKLFQPFFTTKGIGQGTGLGLSISLGIIRDHGGVLSYDRTSPNTRFVIDLPLYRPNEKKLAA